MRAFWAERDFCYSTGIGHEFTADYAKSLSDCREAMRIIILAHGHEAFHGVGYTVPSMPRRSLTAVAIGHHVATYSLSRFSPLSRGSLLGTADNYH